MFFEIYHTRNCTVILASLFIKKVDFQLILPTSIDIIGYYLGPIVGFSKITLCEFKGTLSYT